MNENKTVLKRLLKYTKPYSAFLILSLVCSVISVLMTLAGPVFVGKGIDLIIGKEDVDFASLPSVLAMLALTAVIGSVFQWLTSYFNNIITYRTAKDLRVRLFEKLNSAPLKYIDRTPHGDIISRATNDIDMVSEGLLQGLTQLFSGAATILGTLLFMLNVSPPITLAVVLLTPLSLFVSSFIANGSFKYFTAQTAEQGLLLGYINEYVGGQKTVKAFGYEKQTRQGFGEINGRLHKCGLKAQIYGALINPVTRFVNGVVYAAVGVAGAVSVINGNLSVGGISMFLTYANQYTKPFNEISGIMTQLQSAIASARRVFGVIDCEDEPADTAGPYVSSDISKVKADVNAGNANVINTNKKPEAAGVSVSDISGCLGQVDLKNVYFSYDPAVRLIEDLTLSAAPGNRIAIVGPTGCGKTTLINLLMRFYDVDRGSVSIDGRDIREVTRAGLRRCWGMVLQDTWLFTGTVRDNIAYGRPDASQSEIEEAAKRARAHGFIERLPAGYDTVISDDGGNLSQGQKQLLCIARVMLKGAPMFILDEATSNIDTRTEIAVHKAFADMSRGHTCFIVAHRLSTIRESDLILVMDGGKIIEQGAHDELYARGGYYRKLYDFSGR